MEIQLFTSRAISDGYSDFEIDPKSTPNIALLLTGPNGVGKGSITDRLLSDPTTNLSKGVRYTSRPMSNTESDGQEYHFVSLDKFEKMLYEKKLIECSRHNLGYYGTGRDILDNLAFGQNNLLLETEAHAAWVLKDIFNQVNIPYFDILLSPVSVDQLNQPEIISQVLRQRMVDRGRGENEVELNRRLFYALETYQNAQNFTHIIPNETDKLDHAVALIKNLFVFPNFR